MADIIAIPQEFIAETPAVRRIGLGDLNEALRQGWRDFQAAPTQLVFLAIIYPVIGALAARAAWGGDLMTLFFPLVSGFALLGPIAALGVYELSRRVERGESPSALDALSVLRSPSLPSLLGLGAVLMVIFLAWLGAARMVLHTTMGAADFGHPLHFLEMVLTTGEGWRMVLLGHAIGALFAALVLSLTVVSFPLLLDRPVGLVAAVRTSLRAVAANPAPMLAWGLIVAALMMAGSALLFVGLAVVIPVLGHATWHLYRRVVVQ